MQGVLCGEMDFAEDANLEVYRDREICGGVTVRALQHKCLEILKYFQKICEENGLRYWCGGGTCIGALRHGGFIPWDDDIDVFMPRPDYEKLHRIWPEVADCARYVLSRSDAGKNNHQTDTQLVDVNTTFINRNSMDDDTEHGIAIDVIPFEGCPRSFFRRVLQVYHAALYSVYNVQRLPDHQGPFVRFLVKIMLALVKKPERRYRIWKKHEQKMTRDDFDACDMVKETVTSFRALFFKYPRSYFETRTVAFEDIEVRVPVGADAYLRRIFGNYMALPPEHKRRGKHNVVFLSVDEPYAKFKGIHFCRKEGQREARGQRCV